MGYAIKNKNEDVRKRSRSGGVFTSIANSVLANNGAVYGCALDEQFMAHHVRIENESDLDILRGSKYIQSDKGNVFHSVARDLQANRYVLFSGTPCEVAGLAAFLGHYAIDDSKLIYVDIVCHGVPSPKVWGDYLRFVEEKYGGSVTSVDFRNKEIFGWRSHEETVSIDGVDHHGHIFRVLFYDHCILRDSCFVCPFKKPPHPSDITIGDFWGIEEIDAGFDDNKGVSLVITNTIKGQQLMETLLCDFEYLELSVEDCIRQPPLKEPFSEPASRDSFWRFYREHSFKQVVRRYVKEPSLISKVVSKLKHMVRGA